MTAVLVNNLTDQARKYWSPISKDALKERSVIINQVSREFEGQIQRGGDTVKVTQYDVGEANQKQVGQGHESFTTNPLGTSQIEIKADQVFTIGLEFDDLVPIQTALDDPEGRLRVQMEQAMARKISRWLFSLFQPSSSNPNHDVKNVTSFDYDELLNLRMLATQALWGEDQRRICLLDPSYYKDLLSDTTVTSRDFGADDAPVIAGQSGLRRAGFEIFEEYSQGLLALDKANNATADVGLAFRPDALHLVMGGFEYKISDLHSNKQHAYVFSLRVVAGAARGHDHEKLCIKIRASN